MGQICSDERAVRVAAEPSPRQSTIKEQNWVQDESPEVNIRQTRVDEPADEVDNDQSDPNVNQEPAPQEMHPPEESEEEERPSSLPGRDVLYGTKDTAQTAGEGAQIDGDSSSQTVEANEQKKERSQESPELKNDSIEVDSGVIATEASQEGEDLIANYAQELSEEAVGSALSEIKSRNSEHSGQSAADESPEERRESPPPPPEDHESEAREEGDESPEDEPEENEELLELQLERDLIYSPVFKESNWHEEGGVAESWVKALDTVRDDNSTPEFYTDPDFPPEESSLSYSRAPEDFEKLMESIVWKRPHEINDKAAMFCAGVSSKDIEQQSLGDCWFVSACSALAGNPKLLKRVILSSDAVLSGDEYKGKPLWFQFYQNGSWQRVVIDDYLPCIPGGRGTFRLVFSKSTDDAEMWVSLVEKAYAKLKGSYEALVGGSAASALTDLTGGISEMIRINEEDDREKLWSRLSAALDSSGCFVTASRAGLVQGETSDEATGLSTYHAYSLMRHAEFEYKNKRVRLVRVRNPWANEVEFKGDWRDSDPVWQSLDRMTLHKIGYVGKPDGEFFMSFEDFSALFATVTVCTVEPDFLQDGTPDNSFQLSVNGSWVSEKNAGGCMNFRDTTFPINPQYLIVPDKKSSLALISLLQFHPPSPAHRVRFQHIGMYVYELSGGHKKLVRESQKLNLKHFQYNPVYTRVATFANFQEVVLRMKMSKNCFYVVIPCTFQPDVETEFVLRVYCDTKFAISELK